MRKKKVNVKKGKSAWGKVSSFLKAPPEDFFGIKRDFAMLEANKVASTLTLTTIGKSTVLNPKFVL